MTTSAPSFEAPITHPTEAPRPLSIESPVLSRSEQVGQSVSKFIGTQIEHQVAQPDIIQNPRPAVQRLAELNVVQDAAAIIRNLERQNSTPEEIDAYINKLKLGTGSHAVREQQAEIRLQSEAAKIRSSTREDARISPVVREQQKQLRLQSEAAKHTSRMQERAAMSPAVRAQQDERSVQIQAAKARPEQRVGINHTPIELTSEKKENKPDLASRALTEEPTQTNPKVEAKPVAAKSLGAPVNPPPTTEDPKPSGTPSKGPESAGKPAAKPEGEGKEEAKVDAAKQAEVAKQKERESKMQSYIKEAMNEWKEKNPKPANENTPQYDRWATDRAYAYEQAEIDALVHQDLEVWKEKHPPNEKNEDEYNKWFVAREKERQALLKKHEDKRTLPKRTETKSDAVAELGTLLSNKSIAETVQKLKDAQTPEEKAAAVSELEKKHKGLGVLLLALLGLVGGVTAIGAKAASA